MNISQLTSWKGEINRRDYLIWGMILFAVKYNLDRITALLLNRTWYITEYFIQADQLAVQELSGEDQKFYPAKGKIEGGSVLVSAKEVKNPVAVRFGWKNESIPNLFSKEGLPVSSFRTDDWPILVP